jgi:hypothetical protein
MNVDTILDTLNRHGVDYLLIEGMNFFIRHVPVATFDVDVWIRDEAANRLRCERALADLDAEWGETEADWGPVQTRAPDWLGTHEVFCLTSRAGDIDIFRRVSGLANWTDCRTRALPSQTASGIPFLALSDHDMLACQTALPPGEQHLDRIRHLRNVLGMDRP